MLIKMDESLITGICDIDAQHELLFDAINNLAAITKNKQDLWFVVEDIKKYAAIHFQTEEKYMREYNYPEIEEHIKEHADFSEKFVILRQELEENGLSENFVQNFRIFLVRWIMNHYTNIDVKMAEFIKKAKQSQ